jgi:hypothetical protein
MAFQREGKKTENVQHVKKIQYVYLLKKYIKWGVWRVAVCPFYIWDAQLLKVNTKPQYSVDRKRLERFEMWCWRRMEKISWTGHVRNEGVLLRVEEKRNILHEISKRKANWVGHILCRNCFLQQVIEGKIKGGVEVTGRRRRRRRKLLDNLKERGGYSHLKEDALDRTMWRVRFGRGFGPAVRMTNK